MSDVLKAYDELRQAEAAAEQLIQAARLNFGRAIHEARHVVPVGHRLKQEDIAREVGLKRERLRQIERTYEKSLTRPQS